ICLKLMILSRIIPTFKNPSLKKPNTPSPLEAFSLYRKINFPNYSFHFPVPLDLRQLFCLAIDGVRCLVLRDCCSTLLVHAEPFLGCADPTLLAWSFYYLFFG